MNKFNLGSLKRIFVVVSILGLVCVIGGSLGKVKADSPAWAVSGLWSEACPCNPPCPCWRGKAPTFDHCENIQAFKITKGQYGDVPLDGVVVVVVWVAPGSEPMRRSMARLFAIYLDASTTQSQRDAVEKIWRSSYFSGVEATRTELKSVKLNATIRRDFAEVSIPGILTYQVRQSEGNNAVDLKQGTRSDFRQGESVAFHYSDFGMQWEYPGKHAMFANFQVQSPSGASLNKANSTASR